MLAVLKAAPALACGCTVVLKTSEKSPLTALAFCKLVQQAVRVQSGLGVHAEHVCGCSLYCLLPSSQHNTQSIYLPLPFCSVFLSITASVSLALSVYVLGALPSAAKELQGLGIRVRRAFLQGFPPGVFNVLSGWGDTVGSWLIRHPLVSKVSFTGSSTVGRLVAEECAATVKRVTLELGGKSPLVVLNDANVEKACEATWKGLFFNSGTSIESWGERPRAIAATALPRRAWSWLDAKTPSFCRGQEFGSVISTFEFMMWFAFCRSVLRGVQSHSCSI